MKILVSILFFISMFYTQNDFKAKYSYDGSKIVFYSYRYDHRSFRTAENSDLLLMDSDGKFESRITFGNHYIIWPFILPNNKEVVFSEGMDMSSLVAYRMQFDGKNKIKIGNGVVSSISSDGNRLAILKFDVNKTETYTFKDENYKKDNEVKDGLLFFSYNFNEYIYIKNFNELYVQKNINNSTPISLDTGIYIGHANIVIYILKK